MRSRSSIPSRREKRNQKTPRIARPWAVRWLARVPGLDAPVLSAHNSWIAFSSRRLWRWNNAAARRLLVNHYLGMTSRLHHVNLWDTIAVDDGRAPIGPQRWHRDPDDVRLVKVFLHFTDVTAGSGPLEYVPHSRPGEAWVAVVVRCPRFKRSPCRTGLTPEFLKNWRSRDIPEADPAARNRSIRRRLHDFGQFRHLPADLVQ